MARGVCDPTLMLFKGELYSESEARVSVVEVTGGREGSNFTVPLNVMPKHTAGISYRGCFHPGCLFK